MVWGFNVTGGSASANVTAIWVSANVTAIWVIQQDPLSLHCSLSTLYHKHTDTAGAWAAQCGSMSTKRAAAARQSGVSSKKQKLEVCLLPNLNCPGSYTFLNICRLRRPPTQAAHAADQQQLLSDTILALLRKRKPGATC